MTLPLFFPDIGQPRRALQAGRLALRGAEDDTFAATTIAEGRMVRFLFLLGLVGCMCLAAAFLFPDDWRSFRLAVADSTVGPGAVVSDVYDSVRGKH